MLLPCPVAVAGCRSRIPRGDPHRRRVGLLALRSRRPWDRGIPPLRIRRDDGGPATRLKVAVESPATTHELSVAKLQSWLESSGKTPRASRPRSTCARSWRASSQSSGDPEPSPRRGRSSRSVESIGAFLRELFQGEPRSVYDRHGPEFAFSLFASPAHPTPCIDHETRPTAKSDLCRLFRLRQAVRVRP